MKDLELRKLLLNRDSSALAILLNKYGGLFSYMAKNMGISNAHDIEECISDITYLIWKKVKKYDHSQSAFKTWTILVAKGCIIDYVRKNKKHSKIVSIDHINQSEVSYSMDMSVTSIADTINKLPPPDDEIFFRKYILGETVTDISKVLGKSVEAVYKRINRGKSTLYRLLKQEEII